MKTRFLPLSSLLLTFLTLFTMHTVIAQVPSYVPTNGLVGYWPFNGNANDESGNGNNGTVNGATLTTDRFGNANRAYSFDGVDDFISNLTNGLPYGNTDRTLNCWFRKEDNNSPFSHTAVSYGSSSQSNAIMMAVGNNNNIAVQGWADDIATNFSNVSYEWHMMTFTLNQGVGYVYYDGVLVASQSVTQWNTIQSSFYFGSRCDLLNSYFFGQIDDIGIWNRALTADEVLALYNGCNVTPIAIAGSNTPGAFTTSTYTCDNTAGSTYNWTVSNGVIASGQGTNSVSILWGAEGVGSVSAVETTADGCVGDAVIYDVNVQCVVSGNAIEGPVGPEAFSNSIYTCNGAANSTYTWTVTNGVIVSGQGTNSVTILWASTGIGNVSVIETTAEGCVGTELTQDVVVVPVNVEEFSSSFSLFPNPATTELNLQTTNDLIGSDLIIFDALGKQIHKQQILSTNTRINTSAFAAGNYVVKVGEFVRRIAIEK